jgi:hypothetical protein
MSNSSVPSWKEEMHDPAMAKTGVMIGFVVIVVVVEVPKSPIRTVRVVLYGSAVPQRYVIRIISRIL